MADRVAAMMADIEAKQREVERIIAEEAKKNVVPPLIEVLEDCISYRDEHSRLCAMSNSLTATVDEAKAAYDAVHGRDVEADLAAVARNRVKDSLSKREAAQKRRADELTEHILKLSEPFASDAPARVRFREVRLKCLKAELEATATTREADIESVRAIDLAVPNLDDYKKYFGQGKLFDLGMRSAHQLWNKAAPLRVKLLEARVFARCIANEQPDPNQRLSESTVTAVIKAHLVAARADAEWKIQSFKIIDALTQRVAALEARLDAKETVPLGTPVLGSDPDSGEDSVEDSCEGAEEPVRRTLFPYW